MLDLNFFRDPRFSAASLAISFVFFAMFGTFFLLTQFLQVVRGYSPLEAGLRALPMALTMMIGAPSSARLTERLGAKRVVSLGLAIVAVGLMAYLVAAAVAVGAAAVVAKYLPSHDSKNRGALGTTSGEPALVPSGRNWSHSSH